MIMRADNEVQETFKFIQDGKNKSFKKVTTTLKNIYVNQYIYIYLYKC